MVIKSKSHQKNHWVKEGKKRGGTMKLHRRGDHSEEKKEIHVRESRRIGIHVHPADWDKTPVHAPEK